MLCIDSAKNTHNVMHNMKAQSELISMIEMDGPGRSSPIL